MEYNVKAGEEDEPKCGAESAAKKNRGGVWWMGAQRGAR